MLKWQQRWAAQLGSVPVRAMQTLENHSHPPPRADTYTQVCMSICTHTPIQNKLWGRDKAIWVPLMLWWQTWSTASFGEKRAMGPCHSGKPQQQQSEMLLPLCLQVKLRAQEVLLSQQCTLPKISRGKRVEGRQTNFPLRVSSIKTFCTHHCSTKEGAYLNTCIGPSGKGNVTRACPRCSLQGDNTKPWDCLTCRLPT